MNPELEQLRELESLIADRLYIQIEKWNLSLGNAGLAEALAIECQVNLKDGPTLAAQKALEAVQVEFGSGKSQVSLSRLISSAQIFDLEEILAPYCR